MAESHLLVRRVFDELDLSIVRDEGTGPSYENFVIEGCGSVICVRAGRDRKSEMVDIRARTEPVEWFDIMIVMTFMLSESKLFEEISLYEQLEFLKTNFGELAQLFGRDNYPTIKPQLKSLEFHRAKILFPDWYAEP